MLAALPLIWAAFPAAAQTSGVLPEAVRRHIKRRQSSLAPITTRSVRGGASYAVQGDHDRRGDVSLVVAYLINQTHGLSREPQGV
ncbi:MAG: hypothetical protein ACJASV_000347 [Pseudorhodobacter sp.]|jgi:hypothetical protein